MLENLSIPVGKVVAGVAGASVVGGGGLLITYGTGGFGGGRSTAPPKAVLTSSVSKVSSEASNSEMEFDKVDTFKTKKGGDCFKYVFGENAFNDSGASPDLPSNSSSYFGNSTAEKKQDVVHGCLLIQTKYSTVTDAGTEKWQGSFSWVWAFKNGTKGFIVFGFAKTKQPNQLDLDGAFYLLSYESNKWKIKHKKEAINKQLTSSDFPGKFPKKNSGFTFAATGASAIGDECWDWPSKTYMGSDSSGCNVCCSGNSLSCIKDISTTSQNYGNKHLFTWSQNPSDSSDKKQISGWCADLEWWKHMFDKDDTFKLSTKLNSFTGKWTYQSQ